MSIQCLTVTSVLIPGPLLRPPSIKDNKDGTYEVTYEPPPEGSICIPRVTWGGVDIPGRSVVRQGGLGGPEWGWGGLGYRGEGSGRIR